MELMHNLHTPAHSSGVFVVVVEVDAKKEIL